MRHLGALLLVLFGCGPSLAVAEAVDYVRDVKPILAKHCYSCHGSLRQKSGLRLDHVTFMREGGDNGPAIGATSGESLLIRAITGQADIERMPLEAKPLADDDVATLKAWIDAGARAPDEKLPDDPRQHWSFQKPVRPPLPEVSNAGWTTHPVDRFLAAEHERRGLTALGPAPKQLLLRRVYIDLVGLPPTPAEVAEFLADETPGAYERVVDRLLASPQYGERWGRHWMDIWRYSDWDGYGAEVRESKPHIWRWRDWIIESLNADKSYGQMVEQMLAADELSPLDAEALPATGFLARNWYRFNRNVSLEATVEHTSKAFLGITLNCARCHDHMYDPILQSEYYQFRAIFEPHEVRDDRVAGQSDTARDALVRAYDADVTRPTFLFARGNEAKAEKEHPLSAAVPRVLGGAPLEPRPIALPAEAYYPGLRGFVQQETLAAARAEVDRTETVLAKAAAAVAESRKKLAELVAAKVAQKSPQGAAAKDDESKATATKEPGGGPPPSPTTKEPVERPPSESSEDALRAAVEKEQSAATIAEHEMLAAASALVAARARIAADTAAFAVPPASNASELARESSRAERVADTQQSLLNILRLDGELAAARASGDDDAAKKKIAAADAKLAEARKAHEVAQAALGTASDRYRHIGEVYPTTTSGRRAALARWITSTDNPLTARVAINHIWLRHFGSPLVATVFDFGLNGQRPTHPQLLEWLAVELMEGGWRMKPIHRLLVTSAAYRMQSSGGDETNRGRDPENVYLWRMNPRRMEAEAVRDSTLRVAGALDAAMFGPEIDHNQGLTVSRRSVYFRSSKEKRVTFLEMFDSPNVTDCYRRSETVVPQQALAMVNSSLTLVQARRLAAALTDELRTEPTPAGAAGFVEVAFERLLCRLPSIAERQACLEFLTAQAQRFAEPQTLVPFAAGGENTVKPAADPHARARENLIHVLLNHNDFLTVR